MREYISLLDKIRREYQTKYFVLKFFAMLFVLLYYYYINSLLAENVWGYGVKLLVFSRDLIVAGLFAIVYGFFYVAAYFAGVYDLASSYYASLAFLGGILKLNLDVINNLLSGAIAWNLIELLVSVFSLLLIISVILNVGFIVRGKISFFMWSVALIVFSLVGLTSLGYSDIIVPEWPPRSLSELIGNPVVVFAVLTFIMIEVTGSIAYAADIVDGYLKGTSRIRSMLISMFKGRISTERVGVEVSEAVGKLRFSPLAIILLRGFGGIYALEETSEELSSKIVGFIRSEASRESDFINKLLGLKSKPKISVIGYVALTNLLIKLPMSILLAVVSLFFAGWLTRLFPGVVEVQTPAFSLFVIVYILSLMYLLGNFMLSSKRLKLFS